MASEWRYRGRVVTTDDVTSIRRLIAENPGASRRRLSEKLCEAWQWKQANGALRDMVCRGLLLLLHRSGEIELPPVKRVVRNGLARRERPALVVTEERPVRGPLGAVQPVEFIPVRRTPEEPLFNSLL